MIRALKLDDQQLMEHLRLGPSKEERALKQLLNEHGEKIKAFISNHGGTPEEAEDLLYEALTAFTQNVRQGKFQQESAIGTYLFAIAKRMWYRQFERKMSQKEVLEKYAEWNDDAVSFEDYSAVQSSTSEYVAQVLGQLHDRCKEVLLLWAQRFNMDEIAEQLGFKNAQNAMNKKSKCLAQLHKLLEAEPGLRKSLSELRFE